MMFTTLIGATTLALGPCNATCCSGNDFSSPNIVEIQAGMVDPDAVDRGPVRFSDQTHGEVVAIVPKDGQAQWDGSDRERLGGHNAPELIYVRMFDGIFAIDPFQPLPRATDATAQMFFRGTSLQTDRTQFGRKGIQRTKELFRKLEHARINWLSDNGFYGVRVFTNPRHDNPGDEQAGGNTAPEPSAVFERPADVPRLRSREQVNSEDRSSMPGVVAMLSTDGEPVRISLPHNIAADLASRVEERNARNAQADESETEEVASSAQ